MANYCHNCGLGLPSGSQFCPECGTTAWNPEHDPEPAVAAVAQASPVAPERPVATQVPFAPPLHAAPSPAPPSPEPKLSTEPAVGEEEHAPLGYRIAAYVLDASLLFSLMVGVVWIATGGDSTSDAEETILGFGLIAVWLVYVAVTMSLLKGQTLGKALGGIRVIKASGAPAGAGIGVLREVFRGLVLTGFLGIYEAGYSPLWLLIVPAYALWPLFDSRNQALHDRFAGGTRVVKARRRPRRAWIVFPVACAALAAWFALTELASL